MNQNKPNSMLLFSKVFINQEVVFKTIQPMLSLLYGVFHPQSVLKVVMNPQANLLIVNPMLHME